MNNDTKTTHPANPEEETDITGEERNLLDQSIEGTLRGDDKDLNRSALDNVDDDGTLLNEKSSADDISGDDLDIPGAESDDADEEIGEEDEENNGYSEADTE